VNEYVIAQRGVNHAKKASWRILFKSEKRGINSPSTSNPLNEKAKTVTNIAVWQKRLTIENS